MALGRREFVSALEKKGFKKKEGGPHTRYTYTDLNGRRSGITTFMSRGSKYKVLDASLIGKIMKQMRLKRNELEEFVSCEMSQDDYEEIINNRDIVR